MKELPLYILLIAILGFLIYLTFFKPEPVTADVMRIEKEIDSLFTVIDAKKDSVTIIEKEKTKVYENYYETINYIKTISDNDSLLIADIRARLKRLPTQKRFK